MRWTLDSRGNWDGFLTTVGASTTLIEHEVNARSEIDVIEKTVNGGTPTQTNYTYDQAGNLTSDGSYTYEYDAWGRVIKVYNTATGAWILHNTYDGLGRLIRLQRPYAGYTNGRRIEHYYYDGSRRIQEVFHDPVANSSDSEEQSSEGEVQEWTYTKYVASEYVHSPFYVDEQVAQFSSPAMTRPWFPLRDANYNIVGLVDDDGDVRLQRSFTPYGELPWEQTFAAGAGPSFLPWVRAGHQGLFFDRLDGFYASTPITTTSKGLYHNRNRSYSPSLGRFIQVDPNATGLVTAGAGRIGSPPMNGPGSADISSLLGDGFSLHQAYGAMPMGGSDPAGLFFGGMAGMMMSLGTTADIQGNYNDQVVDTGITFTSFLSGMLQAYEGDTLAMAEWAGDWSLEDDLFERNVVEEGADYFVDDGEEYAMADGVTKTAWKAGANGVLAGRRLLGKVYNGYDEAKTLTRGKKLEVHHLIEKRHFAKRVFSGNPDMLPVVVLSNAQHTMVTARLRQQLPYGTKYEKDEIWAAYQKVYSDFPDGQKWLEAIGGYFK